MTIEDYKKQVIYLIDSRLKQLLEFYVDDKESLYDKFMRDLNAIPTTEDKDEDKKS